jgi:hypothetical protein
VLKDPEAESVQRLQQVFRVVHQEQKIFKRRLSFDSGSIQKTCRSERSENRTKFSPNAMLFSEALQPG